jgi:hypothetical protein
VVAANEQEVLELIRQYEVEAVDKDSLEIVDVENDEAEDDEAKGIYAVGALGPWPV